MNPDSNRHYSDEDLLEWALDPSSMTPEAEAALQADTELRRSLESWEATVSELRVGFASEEQAEHASERLADSILAQTTREDLSWRGDLRLVSSFVRRGLSRSVWTKLVAASLIIHISALPILGYMLLVETPERHFNIFLEKPVDPPFEENLPEPDREVDSLDPELGDRLPELPGETEEH